MQWCTDKHTSSLVRQDWQAAVTDLLAGSTNSCHNYYVISQQDKNPKYMSIYKKPSGSKAIRPVHWQSVYKCIEINWHDRKNKANLAVTFHTWLDTRFHYRLNCIACFEIYPSTFRQMPGTVLLTHDDRFLMNTFLSSSHQRYMIR